MNEILIMILVTAGVASWMIGGYRWKWVRRYLWPVVIGVVSLIAGVEWWRCALALLSFVGGNSMGYGDRDSWLERMLTFTLLAVPAWIINFIWWLPLVTFLPLTLVMWLSRKTNRPTWKLWEGLAGLLQAAVVVTALIG